MKKIRQNRNLVNSVKLSEVDSMLGNDVNPPYHFCQNHQSTLELDSTVSRNSNSVVDNSSTWFFLLLYNILCELKVRQIRNDFFKPPFLPKDEQTNSTLLLVDLFSFVFWKKVMTPKRHFEINWPLDFTNI